MMRLFVGLDLPWETKQQLASLAGGIPGARWVPAENYHLTLRFIGEVPAHRAEEIDHALGSLGLHRVALSVFAFNERAIRAYLRVGFVIEGRSREAIWRDGRWWDEIHMSVLEPDWRAARWQAMAESEGRTPVTPGVADDADGGRTGRRGGG